MPLHEEGLVIVLKHRSSDAAGKFISYSDLGEALERRQARRKGGGVVGMLLASNKTTVRLLKYSLVDAETDKELASWGAAHYYWLAS